MIALIKKSFTIWYWTFLATGYKVQKQPTDIMIFYKMVILQSVLMVALYYCITCFNCKFLCLPQQNCKHKQYSYNFVCSFSSLQSFLHQNCVCGRNHFVAIFLLTLLKMITDLRIIVFRNSMQNVSFIEFYHNFICLGLTINKNLTWKYFYPMSAVVL